ncbi:MAG TPA: alpha/beta hydrolase [Bacillota bacterium]
MMELFEVNTKQGNTIEYYKKEADRNKIPVVLSMGNWEPALRGFPLLNQIEDRTSVVLSYRGRGRSGSPDQGYDWKDHSHDLEAVVEDCGFDKCIFIAFSKGVSYTLGYLESNPEKACGLLLIDYPAIHCESIKGYAEFWYNRTYKDFRLKDYVTRKALDGIERESTYRDFYPLIASIKCPVTLFVGRDDQAPIRSNVEIEDVEKYQKANPNIRIIEFTQSGHMILDDEPDKAYREVKKFLSGQQKPFC